MHSGRTLRTATCCVLIAWSWAASAAPLIVLDPGHSPDQGGATSLTGVREVTDNDRFVAELAPALEHAGWQVRITRTPDENMGLAERPALANTLHAAVFLSIHHDSVQLRCLKEIRKGPPPVYETTKPIEGYSLYVSGENPEFRPSLELATLIGRQLRSLGRAPNLSHAEGKCGENRPLLNRALGIYQYDHLTVLRHSRVPAVLLEVGVIVDPKDEAYVDSAANRQEMIGKIVAALVQFRASETEAGRFPRHPGTIAFVEDRDQSERLVPASAVPDDVRFVYEDTGGHETSDRAGAVKRIPVVRIETVSLNRDGKPVPPGKAVSISITYYGPDGRALKHTIGSGSGSHSRIRGDAPS